jgi:hypothetical protein
MTVRYKDTWLKIIGSLFIAHFIEMIGREETIWELLLYRFYYIEAGTGFIMALTIWECISQVSRWLDKNYDWVDKPVFRSLLQLSLGVGISSLLTYLLANIQFQFILNQDIREGDWLLYEFPVTIMFVVFINIFYLGYYFFQRWRYAESLLKAQSEKTETQVTNAILPGDQNNNDAHPQQKKLLLARKGARTFPIEMEEIAYIYKDATLNYLRTFKDETFVIDKTLEELEQLLNPEIFFRANRQSVINFTALNSFMSIENGKLKVILKPQSSKPIIVSQKRAPDFRIWIKKRHSSAN